MSSLFPEAVQTKEQIAEAEKEIERLKKDYKFIEPDRGNLDDPKTTWRMTKPNYTLANLAYFKGKTQNHAQGSLELIVENLVKTWEMESSHKIDQKDWTTVDPNKYTISANGGCKFDLKKNMEIGNYNVLLDACDKTLYDAKKHTFNSSHGLFRNAFTQGFPWEVLKVYSPPPRVAFSWRHWGVFDGKLDGVKGKGETLEMFGFLIAEVNENLKICSLEVYFDPDSFMRALRGEITSEDLRKKQSGASDPICKHKK